MEYDFCKTCPKVKRLRDTARFDIISKAVASAYGYTLEELRNRGRGNLGLCKARQAGTYLCRTLTGASLVLVGKYYSDMGHDSVIYRIGRIEWLLQKPKEKYTAKEARFVATLKLLRIELKKHFEIMECEDHADRRQTGYETIADVDERTVYASYGEEEDDS